jgi:hypothetical protein
MTGPYDKVEVPKGRHVFAEGVEDALMNLRTVESFGGFQNAIQAAGNTPIALTASTIQYVTQNLIVPSTVTLILLPGFSCIIAQNKTLTLNCVILSLFGSWDAAFGGTGTFVHSGASEFGPGEVGPTGAASTVTGPTGAHVTGPTGAAATGPTGAGGAASVVTGPTGNPSVVTGPTGVGGEASLVTGPTGPGTTTLGGLAVTIASPQAGDILVYVGAPTGPGWFNQQPS